VIQKLVWENVKHRPLRTFLSALLIAIPVTLVLTLAGLSKGMIDDATRRYRGVGADIVIRPKGSTFLSLSSAPIDERLVGAIEKQPHVTLALGILLQNLGNPLSTAAGIDPDKFKAFAIKSRVHFHRGFTDSGYCKAFYIVEPEQPFVGTVRLEALDYKHLPRNKFYPYNKNVTFTVKGPGKLSDYPGRDGTSE